MGTFMLGFISGIALMLLKELTALGWKQPKMLSHLISSKGPDFAILGLFCLIFTMLFALVGRASIQTISAMTLASCGLITLPVFALWMRDTIDELKSANDESASNTTDSKRIPVKYEPQYRTASNRPKR